MLQQRQFSCGKFKLLELNAVLSHHGIGISRIFTAHLHIAAEKVKRLILLQSCKLVDRIGIIAIGGRIQQHAPDLQLRIQFMTHLNRPCTGNKLIMPRLKNIAFIIGTIACNQSLTHDRKRKRAINLVKGHPILNLFKISRQHSLRKPLVESDQRFIFPPAILGYQVKRHLIMRNRHDRFDAIL